MYKIIHLYDHSELHAVIYTLLQIEWNIDFLKPDFFSLPIAQRKCHPSPQSKTVILPPPLEVPKNQYSTIIVVVTYILAATPLYGQYWIII